MVVDVVVSVFDVLGFEVGELVSKVAFDNFIIPPL
jgi:hypothetical protein